MANPIALKRSHEQCIALALDLLRLQCDKHGSPADGIPRKENPAWMGNNWAFELSFFLFDAGVTLMSGFSKMPVEARVAESQELIQRSIDILESAAREEYRAGAKTKREIANRAADVLNVLGRELGWRRSSPPPEQNASAAQGFATQPQPETWETPFLPPGMSSFGLVPHPPLPVPMDTTISTPLSMFWPSDGNDFLTSLGLSSQGSTAQGPTWSNPQQVNNDNFVGSGW